MASRCFVAMFFVQRAIHDLDNETSVEYRWEMVGKVIRTYEGEIRVLDVENARWFLTIMKAETELTSTRLKDEDERQGSRQLAVSPDGSAAAHGDKWLSKSAKANIKEQISIERAAEGYRRVKKALQPCWRQQTVRVAVPVNDSLKSTLPREWRLQATICTTRCENCE